MTFGWFVMTHKVHPDEPCTRGDQYTPQTRKLRPLRTVGAPCDRTTRPDSACAVTVLKTTRPGGRRVTVARIARDQRVHGS